MRAKLRFIESNDTLDWETFADRESLDPLNDWGWFTVGVGPAEEQGTDLFQVVACTPTAKHKIIAGHKEFRGVVVDSFDPESIKTALHHLVDSISGADWPDCVRQLQAALHWEYEEMA
ncbi:MAG: Imm8 family immunity protein [Planctomycetota bacterium]